MAAFIYHHIPLKLTPLNNFGLFVKVNLNEKHYWKKNHIHYESETLVIKLFSQALQGFVGTLRKGSMIV